MVCFFSFWIHHCDTFAIDTDDPLKATKVEVLPGRHRLIVSIYTSFGLSPPLENLLKVPSNAEIGHEYKIKYRLVGFRKAHVYVKVVNTGTIIFSQTIYE